MLRRHTRDLTPVYINGYRHQEQQHLRPARLSRCHLVVIELQQAFPAGANAAMIAPPTVRSSRASRSTRHSRRSVASSMAAELFDFTREMSGHFMHMMGEVQEQNQPSKERRPNVPRLKGGKRPSGQKLSREKKPSVQKL